MSSQTAFPRERIEYAVRIYRTTGDAAAALGIAPSSFGRLCRRYGIQTPNQRRKGRKAACRTAAARR